MVKHLFPYTSVKQGSKIILYGAGDVGRDYYYQIKATDYCDIVCWTDSFFEKYVQEGLPVDEPDTIYRIKYDYIVIAVAAKSTSQAIRKELLKKGVVIDKIIWIPQMPKDYTPDYFIEKDLGKNLSDAEMFKVESRSLISADRLDIIVRYLFARDIINCVESEKHKNLYARFILSVNGADEPLLNPVTQKAYSDYSEKQGVDTFIQSFLQLIEAMKKEGFYKENSIPLNRYGDLLNGSHRLASALALEDKVWVRYSKVEGKQDYWPLYRFSRMGFPLEDQIEILRGFMDLYSRCNILVLFGGIIELWDYIEERIVCKYENVGHIDLNFEDDYIAFENLMKEFYKTNLSSEININDLLLCDLRIRIVVFYDKNVKDNTFFGESQKSYVNLINNLHIGASDLYLCRNCEDVNRVKKIFLSTNNHKKAGMQIRELSHVVLDQRLEKLEKSLNEAGISIDDICLSGGAIMEAFGLREADSIGVVFRDLQESKNVVLPEKFTIDMGCPSYCITDPQFYFIFHGFKICNPEYWFQMLNKVMEIKYEKPWGHKEYQVEVRRLKRDLRLLQLLLDYIKYYDTKRSLKKRFDYEIYRQWGKNSYYEN